MAQTKLRPAQFSGTREMLTADRTYYVRTDANDSNTGLANTADGAFLTIQKAIDTACLLDMGVYSVTIQIADGTYSPTTVTLNPYIGSGPITIQGNSSTPANVHISTTSFGFQLLKPAQYIIKDLKITPGNNLYSLYVSGAGAYIGFSGVNFATAGTAGYQLFADGGAKIAALGNYTISGGANGHAYVSSGASITMQGAYTVTLSGTPAWGTAFMLVMDLGYCLTYLVTFSGAATGSRYYVTTNGVCQTYGGGANYFPGNAAGTTATGGQYA